MDISKYLFSPNKFEISKFTCILKLLTSHDTLSQTCTISFSVCEYSCTIHNVDYLNTVEDPSENFQRVRDFVDVRNCQSLPSFDPSKLCKGFSEDMQKEAREKYKLNKVLND